MDDKENKVYILAKKIIIYITIIIISVYILIQLISLTKFCYTYMNYKNYGNELKKRCMNDYIEYETDRYQLFNNIIKYKLNNDNDNNANYLLILIISIIYSIIFSIILFTIIFKILYKLSVDNNNFKYFYYLLILILGIIIIGYIPLYLGLKIDNINLFNKYEKYINKTLQIFIILSIITVLIISIQSDKINNLFILFIMCFFIGIIYYVKLIINLYINRDENVKFIDEDDKDIYYKYIYDIFGLKYYTNKISNMDKYKLNLFIFILIIILISIALILIINRIPILYYDRSSIKNIINCLFYITNNENCYNILFNNNSTKFIYNIIIIPLILLLIIYILINSTSTFNTYINKYLIETPYILYKKDLEKINKSFVNILYNDNILTTTKKIEKNIANTILLVLYNETFSDFLEAINKDQTLSLNLNEINLLKKNINITPEFQYDNDNYINYNDNNEYNINYYLNNKNKEDIFKIDKDLSQTCSKINTLILYYILKYIFFDVELDDGFKHIYYIDKNQDTNINNYNNYKNKIKTKIYIAIQNYKTGNKNYLGQQLDNKNINNLNIRFNTEFTQNLDNIADDIKQYENLINLIIDKYIEYIINVKNTYIKHFKKEQITNRQKNTIEITENNLEKYFIKKYAIDNDSKSFINEYKNIIIVSFKEINHILTTNEIDYDENNKNNEVRDIIKKNYNNYNDTDNDNNNDSNNNNDNEKFDKIVIKDKNADQNNCNTQETIVDISLSEDQNGKLVKVFVVIYFINYYILYMKNNYNDKILEAIFNFNDIQTIYDTKNIMKDNFNVNDIKIKYLEELNFLKNILKSAINGETFNSERLFENKVSTDTEKKNNLKELFETYRLKIIDDIKEISIIDNKNIYDYINVIDIDILFSSAENFKSIRETIMVDTDNINKEILNLIDKIYSLQLNIYLKINEKNLDKINFNKIIKDINYDNNFDIHILNYKKTNTIEPKLNLIDNNNDEIIDENDIIKNKIKVEKTSSLITLLILIYILSYISIQYIK